MQQTATKGDLSRCLSDFISEKKVQYAKDVLAYFDIPRRYVNDLRQTLKRGSLPNGLRRVQLIALLTSQGYVVEDLTHIDDREESGVMSKIYQHLLFNTVSLDDLANLLNIQKKHTLTLLREGFAQEQRTTVLRKCKESESALNVEKERFMQVFSGTYNHADHADDVSSGEDRLKKLVLDDLSAELKMAVPMLEELLENCTPEDRAYVRENAGRNTVFHLANLLNGLCSETARDEYLGGKQ